MIVGAAIVPTAPLLVAGVSPTMPEGVQRVASAATAVLDRLDPVDATVLLAAGDDAVHDASRASLAPIGRPDITREVTICREALEPVAEALHHPSQPAAELPLALSVQAMLFNRTPPIVPVSCDAGQAFEELAARGAAIADALGGTQLRVGFVAAGDLSAGLQERSPLYRVDRAIFWDEQAAAAVDDGRLDGLRWLGPDEAHRVGALGWAPMAVLHGALATTKLGMVVRHYSAPRGVGYLVASG
jgi:hypothetical protein